MNFRHYGSIGCTLVVFDNSAVTFLGKWEDAALCPSVYCVLVIHGVAVSEQYVVQFLYLPYHWSYFIKTGSFSVFNFRLYCCHNTPLADPHYLNHSINSWPLDCLVVSLISGQGYFTFLYGRTEHNIHNREGGRKENKHGLGLAPSARREKFVTPS